MNQNYYVAIMAGGVGSRFWPSSRESHPKQFLDITNSGLSLIQQTVQRLEGLVDPEKILIVSNKKYKELILDQLPMIKEDQLLLEPTRNNTAPCVAYTALHLQATDREAVFAMLPADHIIKNEEGFRAAMLEGFEKAARDTAIVTLGIRPTRPDTGYGYVHYDKESSEGHLHKVFSFKEKPDADTARDYLDSGNYLWNAGIFIWSARTILDQFAESTIGIIDVLTEDISKFGSPEEQEYIDRVYPHTQNISVDFAILEHAQNVFTIPVDIGWSDLGTWNSLYEYLEKDDKGNVRLGQKLILEECSGNIIRISDSNKMIVAKGLEDFIVVDEGNVLLIYPREKEQEIKKVKTQLNNPNFD